MFRITRKADYAVFILSYLARRAAEEGRDALVSAQELASFSALNKSLVANLLKDLTRAGFLGSVRGARGGYRLARSPRDISLAQILRAVEGPFTFVECAQDQQDRQVPDAAAMPQLEGAPIDHESCNLAGLCQSKGPLLVLHSRIQQLLEDLKLVELAGIESRGPTSIPAEFFPSGLSSVGRNGKPAHQAGASISTAPRPPEDSPAAADRPEHALEDEGTLDAQPTAQDSRR